MTLVPNRLRHKSVLLKLHILHERVTALLTLSAQSVDLGRLDCKICGVYGELNVQSSCREAKATCPFVTNS